MGRAKRGKVKRVKHPSAKHAPRAILLLLKEEEEGGEGGREGGREGGE
jgi:hypothetical protein